MMAPPEVDSRLVPSAGVEFGKSMVRVLPTTTLSLALRYVPVAGTTSRATLSKVKDVAAPGWFTVS